MCYKYIMAYNDKLKEKGVNAAKLQEDFGIKLRWAQYILAGKANMPLEQARAMSKKYKIAWKEFR
jgi:antitoxin component HigA of HigAB toxin-antitoxin module